MKRVMGAALLFLSIGIISANTLSLESNNDGTWNVNFTSDADIAGFQFNVDDVPVNSAFGGEADANGFFISTNGTMVLGFSLTGATIPAGEGVLTILSLPDVPEAIINIVMSDAFGNQLDFTYLPSDDESSEDPFTHNSSVNQAFYFFDTVAINGITVEADDWVGAFNGDICVGARKWDTSLCGNGVCDLPVMGDDGSEVTVGYMNTGEFPTFKIYDASENTYYDATPSNDEAWINFGLHTIPNLNGWIWGCTDLSACNYDEAVTMEDGS